MMTIIVFWALVLVSLKLLVMILIDAFRPLPKPTGKREPRESMFQLGTDGSSGSGLCLQRSQHRGQYRGHPEQTNALLLATTAQWKQAKQTVESAYKDLASFDGRGPDDLPSWSAPPASNKVTVKIDLWGLDLKAILRLVGLRKWRMKRVGIRQFSEYRTLGSKVVRAKLALAKNLSIDLQRVLDEDLWAHPDYLHWNGLNLNLVLGTRSNKAKNLDIGWIKKSTYYDYEDGSPTPDYYVWMLPNHDFTEWEVMGVLSYAEVGRCIHRMRRSNSSAKKRGSSYRRQDIFEGEQMIGIRKYDYKAERRWTHPLDWYRKVTSTKAGK